MRREQLSIALVLILLALCFMAPAGWVAYRSSSAKTDLERASASWMEPYEGGQRIAGEALCESASGWLGEIVFETVVAQPKRLGPASLTGSGFDRGTIDFGAIVRLDDQPTPAADSAEDSVDAAGDRPAEGEPTDQLADDDPPALALDAELHDGRWCAKRLRTYSNEQGELGG